MYLENWQEFKKAAEKVYLNNPDAVRCVLKYSHDGRELHLKITDDVANLQFKTDLFNEYKQVETFVGELMTQMTAK